MHFTCSTHALLWLLVQASMALGVSVDVVANVLPMHHGFEHHFDTLNVCIIPSAAAEEEACVCTVSSSGYRLHGLE